MKPCPFCKSTDVGYAYPEYPKGNVLVTISCCTCGAHGPLRAYTDNPNVDDDDEAEASWDLRHNV